MRLATHTDTQRHTHAQRPHAPLTLTHATPLTYISVTATSQAVHYSGVVAATVQQPLPVTHTRAQTAQARLFNADPVDCTAHTVIMAITITTTDVLLVALVAGVLYVTYELYLVLWLKRKCSTRMSW